MELELTLALIISITRGGVIMGNEELNYGDKIALKNWENFSQKKDREFNAIIKLVIDERAEKLVRDSTSFKENGSLSTGDLDAVTEILAFYCQTHEAMRKDVGELVFTFFDSDTTRPFLTEFLTSLHDEFVKRIGERVKSLAEMWGKIDAIKKEYNYKG